MRIWVVVLAIFVVDVSSEAFFFGNNQNVKKRESHPVSKPQYSVPATIEIEDGYGAPAAPVLSYSSPVKKQVKKSITPQQNEVEAAPIEIDDGYGSPAAPVLSAEYNEPESYSSPVKVKKSIAPQQNEVESAPIEIDDGYGSPAAPVISAAPSEQPVYYKRPPRHYQMKKYRRPKKMSFNILDYMPMMNLLMMATAPRKPKRHITYQSQKNRHVRMPSFRMPKFRMPKFRMPKPLKYPVSFSSTKKPTATKTFYSPSKSPNAIKLEYSGWQPIELNTYSPKAPEIYKVEPETEIITIDNAHRHPKKYEVPALPTGTYAPEPITAKPSQYEKPEEVVYGVPEVAIETPKTTYYNPETPKVKKSIFPQQSKEESTTNANSLVIKELPKKYGYEIIKELPKATYPSQEPPAPIEEPLFNSAPVQDLTSLAGVGEYETPQPVYSGYSQVNPGSYQATHNSNHLAQEVQSGSVYVQQKESLESELEEDEDLYFIFYDKNKTNNKRKVTPSPGSASTASFSIQVNGQSHGFSHNLDHFDHRRGLPYKS